MSTTQAEIIDIETLKQWRALGKPVQILDVRSATEFATGHLPGAVNVPLEQVELRTADLDPAKQLVLVCQGGTRARMAAQLLGSCQMPLAVLQGGMDAWIDSGNPVIRSVAARWALERQVRFGAGLLVAAGVLLGARVSPWWLILPGFIGCGLTFAGLTGFCPMGEVLAQMPWNRARRTQNTACAQPDDITCSCGAHRAQRTKASEL